MSLFKVTTEDLLAILNKERKVNISEKDIFGSSIKLSIIKKIDTIFNKGIPYYIDPNEPSSSSDESIFFRKSEFNADLNLTSRQIINRFEQEKISFSSITKLADFKLTRRLPVFNFISSPRNVAQEVRSLVYPAFEPDQRNFLKALISKLSEQNIIVFEFIESHNKREKANIDGSFISPNVIVLRRIQRAFRREIFTLAHELGHYLLNKEEIDSELAFNKIDANYVEKWCNDFAFFFLAGDSYKALEHLPIASSSNDYFHAIVDDVSQSTHLSTSAIYTRLLIEKKVSLADYKKIISQIMREIKAREEGEKKKREFEKQAALADGKEPRASQPKPIISPLYLSALRGALSIGVISERDFCTKLNIKPEKIERYMSA